MCTCTWRSRRQARQRLAADRRAQAHPRAAVTAAKGPTCGRSPVAHPRSRRILANHAAHPLHRLQQPYLCCASLSYATFHALSLSSPFECPRPRANVLSNLYTTSQNTQKCLCTILKVRFSKIFTVCFEQFSCK